MAAPTTEFRAVANSLATTALDTASERKTAAAAGTLVDASGANPLDFGLVSIAGAVAAVRSAVKHLLFHCTNYQGNSQISNLRAWFAGTGNWGFDQAGTRLQYRALRYEAGANGSAYVVNADENSYGGHAAWDVMAVQANAPTQNLFAGNGATSFSTGATDDVVGLQALLEVDPAETSGTYLGTVTAGYEMRLSLRFDFS